MRVTRRDILPTQLKPKTAAVSGSRRHAPLTLASSV